MKQIFLKKEGNGCLLIFFAGWGADSSLFNRKVAEGYDYLLCFDYSRLDFDFSLVSGYRQIRLLAWSMGVWAASQTFAGKDLPWEMRIAVNGTNTPIDDNRGIPVAVFNGTLDNFSAVTLAKFRRRMCGSAEGVRTFLSHNPYRTPDDLHGELAAVREQVFGRAPSDFAWDVAVISAEDKIFPAANLLNAFRDTDIRMTGSEHYDEELFNRYIGGEEDVWTRNL